MSKVTQSINDRCPLQNECGRKRCDYKSREQECSYYYANARPGAEIDGQAMDAELEAEILASLPEAESTGAQPLAPARRSGLVMLPVEKLYPHPDNPRKDLGDLTELADSIRANGIYQNLTVIPEGGGGGYYTVVIGHRRLAAAKLAGLTEVPCVVAEMDRREQLQTMLLENMQRSELTAWEQAKGFQMMLDLGISVEDIAKDSGFSQKTVRSRLKMAELDADTLRRVSDERQITIGDLDELSKIDDLAERNRVLKEIGTSNYQYSLRAALRAQEVQKVLPEVKRLLKCLKCTPITAAESYGYLCLGPSIDVRVWAGEAILPKGAKGQVYYCLAEKGGYLNFYRAMEKKAPAPSETAERQCEITEMWAGLEERAAVAYQLRSDFVKNLRCGDKNREKVLSGALIAATLNAFYYIGVDRDTLSDALGLDREDGKVYVAEERTRQALEALKNPENRALPMAVYALFGDKQDEMCVASGYRKDYPRHYRSMKLTALYGWLTSLGYVISDEERELLDGTHKLYRGEAVT